MSAWRVVALWAVLMAPLLGWGLASRAHDALLFGGATAWEAERYQLGRPLRERQERQAGADTDLNPLGRRDEIVHLTADESARAEILRRYRLFSRQPDEMITFMALQRMRPRQLDFDPRLYQYGGGYIYLIGAALAATSAVGITQLSSDVDVYLEQPELFARFYVVARAVTLVFGALLLVAAWKLARRAAGRLAAWLTLLLIAATPLFINGVLEVKPHVPSACLLLWATLRALDYYAGGRRRDALRMGLQAGYAFGLVLTGIVGALLWPVLLVARGYRVQRDSVSRWQVRRHLLAAAGVAVLVYLVTNPYIPYNLLFNRAALASNVENSTAMYAAQMRRALTGAVRVFQLLVESGGPGVLLMGVAGLLMLLRRWRGPTILAASTGAGMLLLAALLGADKPAEYARFLVAPLALLCVASGCALAWLARRRLVLGLAAAIVVVVFMRTPAYLRSFAVEAHGKNDSRSLAAQFLRDQMAPGDVLGVLHEPAPYAVPLFDFAHREVYWLPARAPRIPDDGVLPKWLVFAADDATTHRGAWWTESYELMARFPPDDKGLSRIAWANKPAFVYQRRAETRDGAAR